MILTWGSMGRRQVMISVDAAIPSALLILLRMLTLMRIRKI
jgi:hypothetical protein